jgi:hypothetical protein
MDGPKGIHSNIIEEGLISGNICRFTDIGLSTSVVVIFYFYFSVYIGIY